MSVPVSAMTQAQRTELMTKLGDILTGFEGIKDKVKIKISRETVCALAAGEMQDTFSMAVTGSCAPELKDQVEAFKAKVKEDLGEVEGLKMDVKVMLGPGCKYDTIKGIVPIRGGDPVDLTHTEGEVWLIDFWATWCPPCQEPMAHNEEMLKKRGGDWAGKVKIIGISIDQTADAVVKHVDAKGWNSPIHYHRAKSNCSEQYAVSGVPNVMLVDTKGMIVFKGHPANRSNLEQDFDDLLAGKTITGPGTEAAGGDDEEEGEAGSGKNPDPETSLAAIDEFNNTIGPALQKDEKIAGVAKTMPRAFCVMVYEQVYNINDKSSKVDWKNYRVLVGPQAAINTVKEIIEEKVKGDFEVVLREHAI